MLKVIVAGILLVHGLIVAAQSGSNSGRRKIY